MGPIFASVPVRSQRAREMLLTLLIVGAGLVAALEFNFPGASLAIGALAGFLMMYLTESLWPTKEDPADRTQWKLFLGVLVIPCAVVSGGVLIYAVRLKNITDTYFAAFLLASVLYAPVQLWRISKRASE